MTYHAMAMAQERYDTRINLTDGIAIEGWIRGGDPRSLLVRRESSRTSVYAVRVNRQWLAAEYTDGEVVNFLPRNMLRQSQGVLRRHKAEHGMEADERAKSPNYLIV